MLPVLRQSDTPDSRQDPPKIARLHPTGIGLIKIQMSGGGKLGADPYQNILEKGRPVGVSLQCDDLLILHPKERCCFRGQMNMPLGNQRTVLQADSPAGTLQDHAWRILEIPRPVSAVSLNPETTSGHYITYWWQYDSQGVGTVMTATYHSVVDEWYLILPTDWLGKITVGRDDSRSSRGERAVVFYYWPDQETTTAAQFLTVYCLTGDNRYTRARLSGRVTLLTTSSAIYCVSLNESVWNCGLKATDLASRFNLITPEWSTQ